MPTPGRNDATPAIRDSSRNRLQRLGALYSGSETISSPVHKNEARFDEAELKALPAGNANNRNTARSGKLAALASSINSWEDESSVHSEAKPDAHHKEKGANTKRMAPAAPKVIGTSPRKHQTNDPMPKQEPPVVTKSIVRPTTTSTADKAPSKQLKWDKNVMDSLEAQGFTRRESTTSKMVYDYASNESKPIEENKIAAPKASAPKVPEPPKALGSIGKGLVSGRAALFESGSSSKSVSRMATKDPAEMSLKDRLALFEKNKGTALIPKAAFGMSASQTQISNNTSGTSTVSGSAAARPPIAVQRQRDDHQQQPNKSAAAAAGSSRPISIIQTPPVTEKPKIDAYNKPGKYKTIVLLYLINCVLLVISSRRNPCFGQLHSQHRRRPNEQRRHDQCRRNQQRYSQATRTRNECVAESFQSTQRIGRTGDHSTCPRRASGIASNATGWIIIVGSRCSSTTTSTANAVVTQTGPASACRGQVHC